MQSEHIAVATHESVTTVAGDTAKARAPLGVNDQAGVDRQPRHLVAGADFAFVQIAKLVPGDVDRRDAGPAGVDSLLGKVLLGRNAERRRLDPHRQVLGDDGDLLTIGCQVHGHGKDAAVVVSQSHTRRQRVRVGVVQLDPQRSAGADRDREVESSVLDAQLIEVA